MCLTDFSEQTCCDGGSCKVRRTLSYSVEYQSLHGAAQGDSGGGVRGWRGAGGLSLRGLLPGATSRKPMRYRRGESPALTAGVRQFVSMSSPCTSSVGATHRLRVDRSPEESSCSGWLFLCMRPRQEGCTQESCACATCWCCARPGCTASGGGCLCGK